MTDKMIEQLQDYAKLQDTLILIEHKLDGGNIDAPLPTFHDEWVEEQVEKVLDKIHSTTKLKRVQN